MTRLAATPTAKLTVPPPPPIAPWLTADDLFLFNQGNFVRGYEKLGAHPITRDGVAGTQFAVWAPSAKYLSVVGTFNDWNPGTHPLELVGGSGIWAGFIPGVKKGECYKYHIATPHDGYTVEKADPYGVLCEVPAFSASSTWKGRSTIITSPPRSAWELFEKARPRPAGSSRPTSSRAIAVCRSGSVRRKVAAARRTTLRSSFLPSIAFRSR